MPPPAPWVPPLARTHAELTQALNRARLHEAALATGSVTLACAPTWSDAWAERAFAHARLLEAERAEKRARKEARRQRRDGVAKAEHDAVAAGGAQAQHLAVEHRVQRLLDGLVAEIAARPQVEHRHPAGAERLAITTTGEGWRTVAGRKVCGHRASFEILERRDFGGNRAQHGADIALLDECVLDIIGGLTGALAAGVNLRRQPMRHRFPFSSSRQGISRMTLVSTASIRT